MLSGFFLLQFSFMVITKGSISNKDYISDQEIPWKNRICETAEISHCLSQGNLSNTVVFLRPNIDYTLGSQILHNNITNFKLVGRKGVATVKCMNLSGLLFFGNSETIEITNVEFTNCGDIIPEQLQKHFPQVKYGQQAVIYISGCKSLVLKNCRLKKYQGFGFFLVNVHRTFIDKADISYTNCCLQKSNILCHCAAIVMYYVARLINSGINLTLQNSHIHYNWNTYNARRYLVNTSDNEHSFSTATSVTLIIAKTIVNEITISGNNFSNNYGIVGAGILIVANCSRFLQQLSLSLEDNYFGRNLMEYSELSYIGSAIKIELIGTSSFDVPNVNIDDESDVPRVIVLMKNITVTKNSNKSSIFILSFGYAEVTVNITDFTCSHNVASNNGMCLTAKVWQSLEKVQNSIGAFKLHLCGIKAYFNEVWNRTENSATILAGSEMVSRPALLMFINIPSVFIEGTPTNPCHLYNNSVPALISLRSVVRLSGTILFTNFQTSTAFHLADSSYLILKPNLNLSFTGHYISSPGEEALIDASNDPSNTEHSFCALQLELDSCDTRHVEESYNIKLFNGSVFQLTPAHNCIHMSAKPCSNSLEYFYRNILGNGTVRSSPIGVYVFDDSHQRGEGRVSVTQTVYPGHEFVVCLALMDYMRNVIPGTILIELYNNKWNKLFFQSNQTKIVVTSYDYTNCKKHRLVVYSYRNIETRSTLVISQVGLQPTLVMDIRAKSCPPGFSLTSGSCECNHFIHLIRIRFNDLKITCKINHTGGNNYSAMITVQERSWLGFANNLTIKTANSLKKNNKIMNDSKVMLYSVICPLGFCKYLRDFVDLRKNDDMCHSTRKGQLCGECKENYSVVFGSKKCQKCSNKWIWTIPVYMFLGVLLVLVLFLLELTINHGAFASVIFHSNIVMFGLSILNDINPNFVGRTGTLIWFISFSMGFPICLYDGMTDSVKMAANFCFPLYTWFLVILVIAVSKKSTFFSNWIAGRSVQVLVTIFHLTFTDVLMMITLVVTPLKVIVEDVSTGDMIVTHVWNASPAIPYGSTWQHIGLIFVACGFLLLVIPYLLLSIFVPFCWRYRFVIRFRPVFETMYAPYKQRHSYWFGVRVSILCLFASISALTHGLNIYFEILLYQIILIVLITVQGMINPFKNKLVNIIDMYFLFNATFLYALGLFQALRNSLEKEVTKQVIITMYGTVLLLTVGILIYHVLTYIKPVNNLLKTKVRECLVTECFRSSSSGLCFVSKFLNMLYDKDVKEYEPLDDDSNTALREPLLQD